VQASNNSVATETARAELAETNLSGLISTETTARIAGDAATLASANTYTDTSVTAEATARIAGDAASVSSANSFTTSSVSAEATLRAAGDASTLSAAELFSGNASNITSGTVGQSFLPSNVVYNNQANTYTTGKQTLAASTTAAASMNVPAGAAPTTLVAGDLYTVTGANSHIRFVDQSNVPQAIAFLSDITNGSVTLINTGAGLTGGPITNTGTISIATAGVTNAMLANPSLTVTAGTGLSGGGNVALGGSITLNNTGVLSLNGSTGAVTGVSTVTSGNAGITIGGTAANPTVSNAGVTSVTGTANQITASASTGGVTLSLPATINVNTSGNAATATTVSGIVGVLNGGTGASTAAGARASLSAAASGSNADITALTGLTTPLATGEGGTGASSAVANTILAGPATGPAAAPAFRAMASADMPAAQRNRTICYIAGSDSPTATALSATNDSIGTYFVNTIGTMTLNSVICYTNSGAVTLSFSDDGLPLGGTFGCSAGGTTTTFQTITGSSPTTLNSGDFLGLGVLTGATATRATVCIAGTVN
jgi:hypothetical protein